MGKKKIVLEKQSSAAQRNATYRKRYMNVTKKAMELSVLSDRPVLIIAGKTTEGYNMSIHGDRSFDAIVMQYLHEGREKIEKAKTECLEDLQKAYKKDHVVDVRSLLHGTPNSTNGEGSSKSSEVEMIKQQISQIEAQLDTLQKVGQGEQIESTELVKTEQYLDALIDKYRMLKALFSDETNSRAPFPIYQRDLRCTTSGATEPVVPTDHQNWRP